MLPKMRIVGLDLAGSDKNDTGLCVLQVDGNLKKAKTSLLKHDDDILLQIELLKPDLVAIDAPLSKAKNGYARLCEEELQQYGMLPQNLRGMTYLVERGAILGESIKAQKIEVYTKASAKILGLDSKDNFEVQKAIINMGIDGDLSERLLKKDEIDAIVAAITGYLHISGKSDAIGDDEGVVIIPKV
jgi:uncharacterized protein